MRQLLKRWALRLPTVGRVLAERDALRRANFFPPGHFYSPLPSLEEVRRREAVLFGPAPCDLPGIDLNVARQLELYHAFKTYYRDLPFTEAPGGGCRYHYDNDTYLHADAIVLFAVLRHLRPRRLIEVGSGYSSCAILDTNERFFDNAIACTFVEPYPERFLSLLWPGDRERIDLRAQMLQDVPPALFEELGPNDVLFIDSSHVSKIGSDVNHLFFQVLPALRRGVWIHFHDIYYPFEYPREWIYQGRAWQEAYLLRAFLQYNRAFSIQFFTTFLETFYTHLFQADMPLCLVQTGGSIWLRKEGVAGKRSRRSLHKAPGRARYREQWAGGQQQQQPAEPALQTLEPDAQRQPDQHAAEGPDVVPDGRAGGDRQQQPQEGDRPAYVVAPAP
jgi:hypothetical protein